MPKRKILLGWGTVTTRKYRMSLMSGVYKPLKKNKTKVLYSKPFNKFTCTKWAHFSSDDQSVSLQWWNNLMMNAHLWNIYSAGKQRHWHWQVKLLVKRHSFDETNCYENDMFLFYVSDTTAWWEAMVAWMRQI